MDQVKDRPDVLPSKTYRVELGCRENPADESSPNLTMYVIVSVDENGNPFEIFTSVGKGGRCEMAVMEGLCRAVSVGLRAGIDPQVFIKQLQGIRCPSPVLWGKSEVKPLSCADGIARVLRKVLEECG
jgi:ribonucleoside-diphosphate reductase alpha chain